MTAVVYLLSVAGMLVAALAVCAAPLRRRQLDDAGDGRATVLIPKPRSVGLVRVGVFYVVSSLLICVLAGLRHGGLYQHAVAQLAALVDHRALAIDAYASRISVDLRLIVMANITVFAVVIRASAMRRLVVLGHAVLFAIIVFCVDAAGCMVASTLRLTTQASSIVGSLAILVVAVIVMLRLISTTFRLPGPTAVADRRGHHWSETVLLAVGALVAVVVVVSLVDLVDTLVGLTHPTAFLVAFMGFPLLFEVLFAFLLLSTRPARPGATCHDRPPLTTITPAFNEESTITRTLEAIDAAAVSYGGVVTVIVVDDGSHDATREVAARAMASFRAAEGRLVVATHGGKAAALNKALSLAESDIVVRVDADVVVAKDAFCHLPGWFANPSVGMVGALALPDPRARSLYAFGRLFECLLGFAFARVALQRVDAVNCIPGTFTAFRGDPARHVGGFVSGMNGEDSDLTMLLGRLGYQVIVDTRIRTYEDVPRTLREFREQRVRWNRAGVHILARHSPLLAGGGSPRTWFFYIRSAAVRVTAVFRPFVFVTGLELSLLDPATRSVAPRVLVFYLVAAVPTLLIVAGLAVRFGFGRRLGWLVVWFPFTLLRRMAALEGLLTMPTRSVAPIRAALMAYHTPRLARPVVALSRVRSQSAPSS